MNKILLEERLQRVAETKVAVIRKEKVVFEPTIASLLQYDNIQFDSPSGEAFLTEIVKKIVQKDDTSPISLSSYHLYIKENNNISFGDYLDNNRIEPEDFGHDPHATSKRILDVLKGTIV